MRAIATNDPLFWGVVTGQLVIVLILSTPVRRRAPSTALVLLGFYLASIGLLLPVVLRAFTARSIMATFLMACGASLGLVRYGARARLKIAAFGSLLFMGLVALVVVLAVTVLWPGETL